MPALSDQCMRDLRAATSAACLEARKFGSSDELWEHVLDVVYPVIQDHARQHTARISRASTVPIQTYGRISDHCGT
ncbi:hypothetical protein AURDEDRAFT_172452 [Auricularia subglabra TFB-10046 SS5]|nr:hypothetical protein AURDEDRAFT_172452 [Auricularia subglabra TFB-10046 SS5]